MENGYKNSKKGWYRKGVYMTDCVDVARSDNHCIFVNGVLESGSFQTFEFEIIFNVRDTTKDTCQFHKHINRISTQTAEEVYKEDFLGIR